MTDTNPRDLIQRLAHELHSYKIAHPQHDDALITEARAYLAQPEPEVPTDDEILTLSHEHGVSYTTLDGHVIYGGVDGYDMRDDVLSFTRAVLARWGK